MSIIFKRTHRTYAKLYRILTLANLRQNSLLSESDRYGLLSKITSGQNLNISQNDAFLLILV